MHKNNGSDTELLIGGQTNKNKQNKSGISLDRAKFSNTMKKTNFGVFRPRQPPKINSTKSQSLPKFGEEGFEFAEVSRNDLL